MTPGLVLYVGALVFVVIWRWLLKATAPRPAPLWACEVAYRERRQCPRPAWVSPGGWSSPERCAFAQDHYGRCEP